MTRVNLATLSAALLLASSALPSAPGEWLPITENSLEIVAGSPIDFSALSGGLAGGGAMTIDGERLRIAGRPGAPINCATLAPGFSVTPGSGFPDFADADRYADQLRRHGYNLVRFHFIDALLMQGSTQDLAFNPQQLARFQYFMGALKKRGIYWMLDLMSSQNAALGGVFPHRWSENRGMLTRIYVEAAAYEHWRRLATQLLATRNPYTGLAPASDPNTAALILVNEANIDMQAVIADKSGTGRFPDLLRAPYLVWLAAHGVQPRGADPMPRLGERSAEMERFQTFLTDLQIGITRRMIADVRKAGYRGPVSAFDNWAQLNQIPTRRELPLIDMHGYDQVPPGIDPGGRVRSASTLDSGVTYLQQIAGVRIFGRPLIVTEHDQPFWNSYRYESGLAVPAFASLQGWEFVCRHADGPVELAYSGAGVRKQALHPDGGGLDPVALGGEALTALLLLRREIAPAPSAIGFDVSDAQALDQGGWRELPREQSVTGWLARIGLLPDADGGGGPRPDLVLPLPPPQSVSQRLQGLSDPRGNLVLARAAPTVDRLRQAGLLPPGNRTDPAQDRWESPTGQVFLLGDLRQLRVVTRSTSAIAFEKIDDPIRLGPLTVRSADASALLAFSALDSAPLAQSRRILVILASDARNTGMNVLPDGTLVTIGELPARIRRVRAAVSLDAAAGGQWTLSPLRLTGAADPGATLTAGARGLDVALDTAMSPAGPVIYFLLERR